MNNQVHTQERLPLLLRRGIHAAINMTVASCIVFSSTLLSAPNAMGVTPQRIETAEFYDLDASHSEGRAKHELDNMVGVEYSSAISEFVSPCLPGSTQVAVFEQPNFEGNCTLLEVGTYPNQAALNRREMPVMSIRVGEDVLADVCVQTNFGGECEVFSVDDADFLDNQLESQSIASMRIYAPVQKPMRITFDNLSPGQSVTNDYLTAYGVYFPQVCLWCTSGPLDAYPQRVDQKVVIPDAGTASTPHALGGGDYAHAQFSTGQSRVKVSLGGISTSRVMQVNLIAKDSAGVQIGPKIVRRIGPGTLSVKYTMEVRSSLANIFSVTWDTDQEDGRGYGVYIDDLEFDNYQPLIDDVAPDIALSSPTDGLSVTGSTVVVNGTVRETSGLSRVWIQIEDTNGHQRSFDLIPSARVNGVFHIGFGMQHGPLFVGTNRVTFRAMDFSGNVGARVVTVTSAQVQPNPMSSTLDVFPVGIELVQGIHHEQISGVNALSTVPGHMTYFPPPGGLIADRSTVLRVYGDYTGSIQSPIGVDATLSARRDGMAIPGGPIEISAVAPILLRSGETLLQKRASLSHSWNFVLPPNWTNAGKIDLYVRINASGRHPECRGCSYPNNILQIHDVRFESGPTLTINPFQVCVRRTSSVQKTQCDMPSMASMRNVLLGRSSLVPLAFPVAQIDFKPLPNPIIYIDGDYSQGGAVSSSRMGSALSKLRKRRIMDFAYFRHPLNQIYYGLIPDPLVGDARGITVGKAFRNSGAAVGTISDFDGETAAHEIGHAIGLKHTPSPVDVSGNILPACWPDGQPKRTNKGYPWYRDPAGNNYPRSSIGAWGLDTRNLASSSSLKDPASHYDMMSYCSPEWISPYHYIDLLRRLTDAQKDSFSATVQAANSTAVPVILVTAIVDAQNRPKEVGPFYVLERSPEGISGSPSTEFSVQLVDQAGVTLNTAPAHLEHFEESEQSEAMLVAVIPPTPGMAELQLVHNGRVISRTQVSRGAPQVRVIQPNGGEVWPANAPATIRWNASDTDGGQLYFTVQYSRDGGSTWQTVAVDLTETEFTIGSEYIAGGNASVIRVLATDGLNTSSDVSDGFFLVADHKPHVEILLPEPGSVITEGDRVSLLVWAYDNEDSELPAESIVWSLDGNGQFASGEKAELNTSGLTGAHTITVAVTDSAGNVEVKSMPIEVSPAELGVSIDFARVRSTCDASVSPSLDLAWTASTSEPNTRVTVSIVADNRDETVTMVNGLPPTGRMAFLAAQPEDDGLRVSVTAVTPSGKSVSAHAVAETLTCLRGVLSVSHSHIEFGSIPTGATAYELFSVYNTGSQPFVIDSLSVIGQNFGLVPGAKTSAITVPAKSRYRFSVLFAPHSAGEQEGVLRIATPASIFGDVEIPLSGSSLDQVEVADLAVIQDLAIDTDEQNGPANLEVIVSNAGPSSSRDVSLTVDLTGVVSVHSFDSSQGQCSLVGGRIQCSLGSLFAVGQAIVHAKVELAQGQAFASRAQTSGTPTDPYAGNDNSLIEITPSDWTSSSRLYLPHVLR